MMRSRVRKFLGPPAPFVKMLMAMLSLLLATYLFVLPEVRPEWSSILNGLAFLGLIGGAMLSGLLLLAWALWDLQKAKLREQILALATLILGFFVLDAVVQLAEKDPVAYLETFVALVAGIVVALVIETKAFGQPKA